MTSRAFRQTRARPRHPLRRGCRQVALASFAASALLFAASPLSALWSLADAVQHGNVVALRSGADWSALRVALKGDLADIIHPAATVKLASARVAADGAAPVAADDDLPEFGSSFATNVVSNAVDDEVTPEHLLELMRPAPASGGASTGAATPSLSAMLHRIAALRFTAPDRFEAAFLLSDQPGADPVRLSMHLEHWRWRVVAVHVAPAAPSPAAPVVTAADTVRRT
ncbi:MAG: DUF2939 domain-containing protein [Gluconacetobacter diazotrophicus]|nr:DUF2939 domain-containing protein [Gluconacetobacter diazotrophicus]